MRKAFFITSLLSFFSLNTLADTQLSLMGSLNYNVPDTNDIEYIEDDESGAGFGLGMRALMGINDQLAFRSGAGIVQKRFNYSINGDSKKGELDFDYTYINIPLTFYWKASSQVGFFFGTALYAKLDDSCDGTGDFKSCTPNDPQSIMLPAILGFSFNLTEKVGAEISYEHGLTDTAKDVKVSTAVLSLLYHFDQN